MAIFFDKKHQFKTKIFAGALSFEVISRAYKDKRNILKIAIKEFLKLRGPGGKGNAQLAVVNQVDAQNQGDVMSKIFSWSNSAYKIMTFSPIELQLICSLTFLNVSWDSIIHDALQSVFSPQLS